jgi:hypothetical protein
MSTSMKAIRAVLQCSRCGQQCSTATPLSMHSGCTGWPKEVHQRIRCIPQFRDLQAPKKGFWKIQDEV